MKTPARQFAEALFQLPFMANQYSREAYVEEVEKLYEEFTSFIRVIGLPPTDKEMK